jgi:hypothetical protein
VDSDEEEFVYPAAAEEPAASPPKDFQPPPEVAESHSTEEEIGAPVIPIPAQHGPSPAQLEALFAASSSGDLQQLKNVFRNAQETSSVEPFALANDASSRTGLTALHAAASRGYLDVVTWRE